MSFEEIKDSIFLRSFRFGRVIALFCGVFSMIMGILCALQSHGLFEINVIRFWSGASGNNIDENEIVLAFFALSLFIFLLVMLGSLVARWILGHKI